MARSFAQNPNEQLWFDLVLNKNISEWTLSAELSPRALLTGNEPHWISWNLSPGVERSMTPHWDLIFGVPLAYTKQTDDVRTFETDIQIGTRFLFTPFKRVQTSVTIRNEQRFMTTLEPVRANSRGARTRVRAEVLVPLDAPSYFADTLWYALADCEVFLTIDQDVDERFANRLRSRIGIGRKFTYNWRAEFIYSFQRSRQAIFDDQFTSDSIFRFRLKYYFSRPDQKREPSDAGF